MVKLAERKKRNNPLLQVFSRGKKRKLTKNKISLPFFCMPFQSIFIYTYKTTCTGTPKFCICCSFFFFTGGILLTQLVVKLALIMRTFHNSNFHFDASSLAF